MTNEEKDQPDNSYGLRPHGLQHFGLRDENGALCGLMTADQIIRAAKDEAYEEVEQDLGKMLETTVGDSHAALHYAREIVRARRNGFSLVAQPVS